MFYDIFERLCNEKGVKPGRAAEECGINRSNVSLWKSKGFTPRSDALNTIADYFGVSVDYLLGNTDQKEKAPAKAEADDVTFDDFTYAMYHESRELDSEDKQALLNMARLLKKKIKEKE